MCINMITVQHLLILTKKKYCDRVNNVCYIDWEFILEGLSHYFESRSKQWLHNIGYIHIMWR